MKAFTIVAGNTNQTSETVNRTIYIATTGNDVTGDGSVGLPYLTIGKALSTVLKIIDSGITVTISIGVGTFTMSAADLSVLSLISGSGTLTIQGTLTLVDSGFTMGAADALDPLTYAVSGGNTATWTLDQWKFYFLKSSTSYYPITHNALTPSISITVVATGTEIYEAQTVINWPSVTDIYLNGIVDFSRLKINLPAITIGIYNSIFTFIECYFLSASATVLNFSQSDLHGNLQRCSFNGVRIFRQPVTTSSYANLYFYLNVNAAAIQLASSGILNITIAVIENVNTGAAASCITFANGFTALTAQGQLKFVNSNVGIFVTIENTCVNVLINSLILKNTNYYFRKAAAVTDYKGNININCAVILGVPVTRWFFDNMLEFVNLVTQRILQVKNIIYPEVEQNLSATLTDNTTTQVIIGNKLQNKSINIDYTITRGTGRAQGTLMILNDGTNLFIATALSLNNAVTEVEELAIVFSANFNTNEIRLAALLSSSGNNATFQYNVSRAMITPLTI